MTILLKYGLIKMFKVIDWSGNLMTQDLFSSFDDAWYWIMCNIDEIDWNDVFAEI